MNILNLADIHSERLEPSKELRKKIKKIIIDHKIDVVVIAGDIGLSYKGMANLVSADIPVVFCLGNHEFFYSSVEETLKKYTQDYNPDKYNVHCLDVIGHYEIDNVNFIGNVLWYDGSIHNAIGVPFGPFYEGIYLKHEYGWRDGTIYDFDCIKEHEKCVQQIKDNFNPSKTNYLVTHCVPHEDLNLHMSVPHPFNGFSGVKNLFNQIKPNYAVCGHTHRYTAKEIDGVFCVNVGNDYIVREKTLKFYVFEI